MGGSKGGWGHALPQVRDLLPLAPQMQFLVSVSEHLGCKVSDYMLFFCQKLLI